MDCKTFRRNLEDYLQGDLDFAGRFGIERHAQHCIGCGKDLADAQKLSRAARSMDKIAAPFSFETDLLRRIESRGLRRRPLLWKLQYHWPEWISGRALAWAAPALALIVAAGLLWTGIDRQTIESPATAEIPLPRASVPVQAAGGPALPVGPLEGASARLSRTGKPDSVWPVESEAPAWFAEPTGTEYVEYTVPDEAGRPVVMRLPKTIRIRHVLPSEEYFIRNVSH
jgi:hypothetical protein